jgi:hypothetical protein
MIKVVEKVNGDKYFDTEGVELLYSDVIYNVITVYQ